MYTGGCGNTLECNKWQHGCGKCPQKAFGRPSSLIFDRSAKEWKLMKNSFEDFNNIFIATVSNWIKSKAEQSPILFGKKIITVENGLDTSTFSRQDYSEIALRHSITNEKIILHVTPNFLNPFKGGNFVIDIANRLIDENVKVIIVGFNGDNKKLPPNVIPVKPITNQIELAQYYSLANITLLTSKSETFSMVCAESLSCGTPIVGFKAGGPESIALEEFSEFVEQGNVDKLEVAVRKWLFIKNVSHNSISLVSSVKYSKESMINKYSQIYHDLLSTK